MRDPQSDGHDYERFGASESTQPSDGRSLNATVPLLSCGDAGPGEICDTRDMKTLLKVVRWVGGALGVSKATADKYGCRAGTVGLAQTKRLAEAANRKQVPRPLKPRTQAMMREIFPDLDVENIRLRTGCRLPANRFKKSGSIYGMTFGYTIYWRNAVLDEDDAHTLVKLIHEVKHVDQVRELGGEKEFACAYGKGYLEGGGELPERLAHRQSDPYHANPLEAAAYRLDAQYRNAAGRGDPSKLPFPSG